MNLIRALLFNVCFYGLTAIMCVLLIPFLILPRTWLINAVRFYEIMVLWIETHVLGLKLEIRGLENLPKERPYIVAAKHYSAYETIKLYYLFRTPAIILKRELTWIPIWGSLALKAGNIAINRSKGKNAMQQMREKSEKIFENKQVLVIFPQGTRVSVDDTPETKPYKFGTARLYDTFKLPVVPMALNTGLFWSRNAFLKKPGTVVFEFLPVIEPGLDQDVFIKKLQDDIETASTKLVQESLNKQKA